MAWEQVECFLDVIKMENCDSVQALTSNFGVYIYVDENFRQVDGAITNAGFLSNKACCNFTTDNF